MPVLKRGTRKSSPIRRKSRALISPSISFASNRSRSPIRSRSPSMSRVGVVRASPSMSYRSRSRSRSPSMSSASRSPDFMSLMSGVGGGWTEQQCRIAPAAEVKRSAKLSGIRTTPPTKKELCEMTNDHYFFNPYAL